MNKLAHVGPKYFHGSLCRKRIAVFASALGFGFALTVAACGGGAASAPPASVAPAPAVIATPPAAASTAPIASAAPATAVSPVAEVTNGPAPARDKVPSTESKEQATGSSNTSASSTAGDSSQPSQSPAESLTAARVAFLIDYANSDVRAKAQANCEKDPKKDDPTAKAACMQKARSQFLPDVLVFQKDKKGHLTLTIYKRNDSELKEVYIAPVSFAGETSSSLQLKFKGGGSGQRPLFKNTNSPTLSMPNDYTLEIEDSEFGKLRYDAKIGLVGK